jgi:hypothetical protein
MSAASIKIAKKFDRDALAQKTIFDSTKIAQESKDELIDI